MYNELYELYDHQRRVFPALTRGFLLLLFISLFGFGASVNTAQILGNNWTGTFYNSTTLGTNPVGDFDYPTGLCFNWGANPPTAGTDTICQQGLPIPGVGSDNFSARFTSTQDFPLTGVYRFTLRYNDGIRLYVNGSLYFDNFVDTGAGSGYAEDVVNISLNAGSHNLLVEYVEFTQFAILQVQWGYLGPGDDKAPIIPTDGRFCFNAGEAGAAIYAVSGGLQIYSINDDDDGVLVLDLKREVFEGITAAPNENTEIARSADGFIAVYHLTSGEFQVNVGPDLAGKTFACTFEFSGATPADPKVTSFELYR